jgi:glutamyl-Q tRNA(Asp) synthetase
LLVTRFAPSPTGLLHLGHAASALTGWRAARAAPGGRFLLRIEDIDATRCRPAFTAAIIEDLGWLGLDWEEPVRIQSEHRDDHDAALARLSAMGVLYPCFCTRAAIAAEIAAAAVAPHGGEPIYPGLCRGLDPGLAAARRAAGEPHALRLDVARVAALTGPLAWEEEGEGSIPVDPGALGDVVLARKDIGGSYHLAVTVDDALQGVTLVTRGRDLYNATNVHRLLQALLCLPAPHYHHHLLLTDAAGQRLAKRSGALTLRQLRAAGHPPAAVRAMAGFADEGGAAG